MALFFQRHGKINFFAGEKPFIETAGAIEKFRGREEETPRRRDWQRKVEYAEKNVNENARPKAEPS